MNELDSLVDSARAAFAQAKAPADLENAKAQFLGKAGRITELMKGMAALPVDEKKSRGAAINVAKQAIEAALDRAPPAAGRRRTRSAAAAPRRSTSRLPGRRRAAGGLHPVSRTHGAHRGDLRQHGLRRGRRPRDRERLAQLHVAQQPAEPSGALDAGHLLRRHQGRGRHRRTTCARTPARCRCATRSSTSRSTRRSSRPPRTTAGTCRRPRSASSRRAAPTASTATPPIRRCSTSAKACGSARTSASRT